MPQASAERAGGVDAVIERLPSAGEFRDAMQNFVGNVSVLTAGTGDERSGLVVTSAISLSADPPLLLACVNRNSSTWPLIERYGCFGWSVLGVGTSGRLPSGLPDSAAPRAPTATPALVLGDGKDGREHCSRTRWSASTARSRT
jgi:hypothetical protein